MQKSHEEEVDFNNKRPATTELSSEEATPRNKKKKTYTLSSEAAKCQRDKDRRRHLKEKLHELSILIRKRPESKAYFVPTTFKMNRTELLMHTNEVITKLFKEKCKKNEILLGLKKLAEAKGIDIDELHLDDKRIFIRDGDDKQSPKTDKPPFSTAAAVSESALSGSLESSLVPFESAKGILSAKDKKVPPVSFSKGTKHSSNDDGPALNSRPSSVSRTSSPPAAARVFPGLPFLSPGLASSVDQRLLIRGKQTIPPANTFPNSNIFSNHAAPLSSLPSAADAFSLSSVLHGGLDSSSSSDGVNRRRAAREEQVSPYCAFGTAPNIHQPRLSLQLQSLLASRHPIINSSSLLPGEVVASSSRVYHSSLDLNTLAAVNEFSMRLQTTLPRAQSVEHLAGTGYYPSNYYPFLVNDNSSEQPTRTRASDNPEAPVNLQLLQEENASDNEEQNEQE